MGVKVLNASRYSFLDKETGRSIAGCKLTYIGEKENSDKFRGVQIITVTGDESIFHTLPQLPADMDVETGIVMKQGKPSAILVGVRELVK